MPERWAAEGNPYQPSGAAWVGADAIVENLFMKLATEWDGFSLHPGQYHDAGDTVVVEGRYMGKYLATGTAVDSQYCHVFKFMSLRPCIRAAADPGYPERPNPPLYQGARERAGAMTTSG